MNELAISFSMLLMCVITAISMIGTIFAGLTNTTFMYLVSVIIAGVAVLVFGLVAADIVYTIKGLS